MGMFDDFAGKLAAVRDYPSQKVGDLMDSLGANKASSAAIGKYPKQGWDEAEQNAARHAIWMALMANKLGGGDVARAAATGVGYANELIGLLKGENLTPAGAIDMRHDLNNNAVGLRTLESLRRVHGNKVTDDQIIGAILRKSESTIPVQSPSVFSQPLPYLTKTR